MKKFKRFSENEIAFSEATISTLPILSDTQWVGVLSAAFVILDSLLFTILR